MMIAVMVFFLMFGNRTREPEDLKASKPCTGVTSMMITMMVTTSTENINHMGRSTPPEHDAKRNLTRLNVAIISA